MDEKEKTQIQKTAVQLLAEIINGAELGSIEIYNVECLRRDNNKRLIQVWYKWNEKGVK